jgi:S-formylglutathione hydrolase FrmB
MHLSTFFGSLIIVGVFLGSHGSLLVSHANDRMFGFVGTLYGLEWALWDLERCL